MEVDNLNAIGLHPEKSKELADLLNDLLANYSTFYQNTRGYHWNISGDKFFELHLIFVELYNDLFLGYAPQHKFTDYLNTSRIPESEQVTDGRKAIEEILMAFKTLLAKQRHILVLSAEIDDEGTNAQMSDYIREQEKLVWMYSAYLKQS